MSANSIRVAKAATDMAAFQHGFARALLARAPEADSLTGQPGFSVYRNTVLSGCVDALQAQYPSVVALVGADWFCGAALEYVHQWPPSDGPLLLYGDRFADFLAVFEPARALAYLPAVARLDRLWSECHVAADAPTLCAQDLLQGQTLATLRLRPHPAARWLWADEAPVWTLWSRTRAGKDPGKDLRWRGEGVLLTRPHAAVHWQAAGRAACALLDACAAALPLPNALDRALQVDPEANPSTLLAELTMAGALAA
ncbi:MAG: DNA-binding domain-containing protein [Burkholderiaceae bacterium]